MMYKQIISLKEVRTVYSSLSIHWRKRIFTQINKVTNKLKFIFKWSN